MFEWQLLETGMQIMFTFQWASWWFCGYQLDVFLS